MHLGGHSGLTNTAKSAFGDVGEVPFSSLPIEHNLPHSCLALNPRDPDTNLNCMDYLILDCLILFGTTGGKEIKGVLRS